MRAFYAVRLSSPKALRSDTTGKNPRATVPLADTLERLARMRETVNVVHPDNLHLTLKFLGDVPDNCASEATRILETVAEGHKPFQMRIIGTGVFPDIRRPRVVWAGVAPSEPVAAIARELDSASLQLGVDRESRSFRPHLTLARLKGPPPDSLLRWLKQQAEHEFASFDVQYLELMKSVREKAGVRYQTLARGTLQGAPDAGAESGHRPVC